jgi:hypothetical protein
VFVVVNPLLHTPVTESELPEKLTVVSPFGPAPSLFAPIEPE